MPIEKTLSLLLIVPAVAAGCKPDCDHASASARETSSASVAAASPNMPTGSNTADSKTHLELQRELARVMLTRSAHQQIITQASAVISQALASSGTPQPEGLTDKLDLIVREALPYDDVVAVNAQIYGKHFTRKELSDMIAFYQTETGAKLLTEQASISQEVATQVSQLVGQRWPAAARKHGLGP